MTWEKILKGLDISEGGALHKKVYVIIKRKRNVGMSIDEIWAAIEKDPFQQVENKFGGISNINRVKTTTWPWTKDKLIPLLNESDLFHTNREGELESEQICPQCETPHQITDSNVKWYIVKRWSRGPIIKPKQRPYP